MSAPGRCPRKWLPLVLVPVLLAGGCGDGVVRLPVEGTVLMDGEPLRGVKGAVTFIPANFGGNEGPVRAGGEIDPEGRYVLFTQGKPGAPPGHYRVLVSAVPPGAERDESKMAVPRRYVVEGETPLHVEVVPAAAPGHYDLKLTAR